MRRKALLQQQRQERINRCASCKFCKMMWGSSLVCDKIPYSSQIRKSSSSSYSCGTMSDSERVEFNCETVPAYCGVYQPKEEVKQ